MATTRPATTSPRRSSLANRRPKASVAAKSGRSITGAESLLIMGIMAPSF